MQQSATFQRRWRGFGSKLVERTRRNHGLEHATVTVLSQKQRGIKLAGRSTPAGFFIYGRVDTEALRQAVDEALARLKAGEIELAVHPNCGTNLIAKGIAAGLTSYFGFLGANTARSRFGRLPRVAALSSIALMLAQPLGLSLQRHITTSGEMGDLRVTGIRRADRGGIVTHFITTES
jgi:hypothetical protein